MGKKVTSTDIARAAGVSQSTVSMVLNKKYNVSFSKETIDRVETAAKELGYAAPKRKAKRGARKEKLLVVFCSNLTNPYYVMLLQGIELRAKEQGFGLFVCNTQRDLKMEERYLKMMWELRPLGIIYTCNPSRCFMGLVKELAEKIPVAVINNQNEKLDVDAVELDNSKLGRIMAEHLLELGHRRAAYIAPPLTARQTAVKIRRAVHIHDRRHQRHTAGRTADLHKPLLVLIFRQIFRLPGLTVSCHNLTLRLRRKIRVIIKWKEFIGIPVEDHIHIHQTLFSDKFPEPIIIAVFPLLVNHTVSCPSRLLRHIIHTVTGSCGHPDHMGRIQVPLHQIIKNPRSEYSPGCSAFQHHCCFYHKQYLTFYKRFTRQNRLPAHLLLYTHFQIQYSEN